MRILFIHGFASSGRYKMADSLRILLRPCEVISPDIPFEPTAALDFLMEICEEQKPDLIVGLSLGGFWAQKLRGYRKILVNPDFYPDKLLRSMKGKMEYLSPRQDGATSFQITEEDCNAYEELEKTQFDSLDINEISLTAGMFADNDELVRQGPVFEEYYPGMGISYPGGHLPNFPQLKAYLVPLVSTPVSSRKAEFPLK